MQSEKTLADLFEFDVSEGIMKNRLTNGRAFILGSSAWSTMRQDMKDIYGSLGTVVVEQMGQSYGRSLGKIGKSMHMNLRTFFETMVRLGSKTGWGNLSLSGGDPLTGRARVRLDDCVFCTEPTGEKACEFFSGVLRGAADEITGKAHSVTETECAAAGGPWCEFFLDEIETPELA